MNGERRSIRTKKLVQNLQKDDKDSRVSVTCRSWVGSVVFDNGVFYKFRACRHGNAVWGGGWELQIARFRVREHLRQWYSISEIMVPSSLKPTSVAVVGPKEYLLQAEEHLFGTRRRRARDQHSPTCS
ncbi:hypothetical protein Zmor_001648 [Zophobas morio]|uniref:Uncharacterized protein n=1 Tax=Zophobas morio TaxID=2755281 RepID=A0AA38IZG5_9CUCU|nr:hypothetical protein Zmor_001648 [Zophobas morio]